MCLGLGETARQHVEVGYELEAFGLTGQVARLAGQGQGIRAIPERLSVLAGTDQGDRQVDASLPNGLPWPPRPSPAPDPARWPAPPAMPHQRTGPAPGGPPRRPVASCPPHPARSPSPADIPPAARTARLLPPPGPRSWSVRP